MICDRDCHTVISMPCSTLDSLIFTVYSSTRDQHIVECTHPAAVTRREYEQRLSFTRAFTSSCMADSPAPFRVTCHHPQPPPPTPLCPSTSATLTLTVTFCTGSPMDPVVKDYHAPTSLTYTCTYCSVPEANELSLRPLSSDFIFSALGGLLVCVLLAYYFRFGTALGV